MADSLITLLRDERPKKIIKFTFSSSLSHEEKR